VQECRVTIPAYYTRTRNLHHQSAARCIETESTQLPANIMAPSIASSGHAPTTLTLKPFHTDPQSRQTQHYRLPRIAQQAPPPRSTPFTPAFSQSVSAATSRNPRSIPSSSLSIARPSVVNTRNTPRAPNVANFAKSSDALVHHPKSPPNTRTARQPVSTVARIHAIAPFSATSIDSVLHAGSTQDANKSPVPDHIRPKAEAIKYGRTQTKTKTKQEH
jgi:hypothetical protein